MQNREIILLDEPSNDLDLETLFLEQFILRPRQESSMCPMMRP